MLLSIDYMAMFKPLLALDPTLKTTAAREIEWAKTHLKKNDRIVWYLRWWRLYWENLMINYIDKSKKLKEKDSETITAIINIFKKDMAAFNAKSKEKITEADVEEFDTRTLRSQLEHFFSLEDPSIQNLQLAYEKPSHVIDELEGLEEKIRTKIESEKRIVNEADKESGDKPFVKFGDGWCWWFLDRAACSEEARAMGHCGHQPRSESDDHILSLREPIVKNGKKYWSPHLTFVMDGNGFLGEMKGRGNDKPAKRYHPYIVSLLKDKRVKGTKGATWYPSKNFKLSDLTEKERKEIYAANPNFADPEKYFREHGKDPNTVTRLAHSFGLDPDTFKPEWDVFIVRQWDDLKQCIRETGNSEAKDAVDWATMTPEQRAKESDLTDINDTEYVSKEVVHECSIQAIRSMLEVFEREAPSLMNEFRQAQIRYSGNPAWRFDSADDAVLADLFYWIEKNTGKSTSVWTNIELAWKEALNNNYRWRQMEELGSQLKEGYMYDEGAGTELRFGADDVFSWDVRPVYEIITYDKAVEIVAGGEEQNLEGGGDLRINIDVYKDYGEESLGTPAKILDKMYGKGVPRWEHEDQMDLFKSNTPHHEVTEEEEDAADDEALQPAGED
jgi:hypothetical protein